ncbi:MAG: DUF2490 domain-containing protein [Flavobacteriales bacterium]|nr:DUF2490 domain-containing protein [Flavobacteriales bacterium]
MTRLLHIVLLLLAAATSALAQQESTSMPETDGQVWMSASTEVKPFRKKDTEVTQARFFRNLRVFGEAEWRLNDWGGGHKQVNLNGGLKYSITKFLRVGSEYRHAFKDREKSDYDRIYVRTWLQGKRGRLDGDYRFTYEHTFLPIKKIRTLVRNRFTLEYDIPKWKLDPYLQVETFTGLHYTGNRLVGMRYDLGTKFNLDAAKRNSLDVAIRFDQETNTPAPENSWVLLLAYELSFNKKKK